MQKKYFTKYLPVEGEIKAGDKFSSYNKVQDFLAIGDESTLPIPTSKVKLFLCSNDSIQVGDNLFAIDGSCTAKVIELRGYNLYVELDNGKKGLIHLPSDINDWAKAIGEVSPEAVWVTEGMEFDEEDIRIDGINPEYASVKFRCPTCKTYH